MGFFGDIVKVGRYLIGSQLKTPIGHLVYLPRRFYDLTFFPYGRVGGKEASSDDRKTTEGLLIGRDGVMDLPNLSNGLVQKIRSKFINSVQPNKNIDEAIYTTPLERALGEAVIEETGVSGIVKKYFWDLGFSDQIVFGGVVERRSSCLTTKKGGYDHAQRFHRDLEGPCLKVFVYLCDVTSQNGAHLIVTKSHKPSRYSDLELLSRFAKLPQRYFNNGSRLITKVGPCGTAFLEDTFAWHAAGPVVDGSREMLTLSFYNEKSFSAWSPLLRYPQSFWPLR